MGCYDLSTGEVCKGLDRLPESPARDRIELAAALVGAVAGVRAEVGMNASTAVKKARLSRKLRDRPLLREVLRRAEITPRKAEVIAPVAVGNEQAHWITRAKVDSVRALQKAVNAPRDPEDDVLMSATARSEE